MTEFAREREFPRMKLLGLHRYRMHSSPRLLVPARSKVSPGSQSAGAGVGAASVGSRTLARLRLRPARRVDKCGSDRWFMTSSGRTSLKTDEGSKCLEGNTCTTGAEGMIAQSVAEIVSRHVKLAVEGIDRMYLNV